MASSGTAKTAPKAAVRTRTPPKMGELVAQRIFRRILRGDLQPGSQLPPEAVLMEEFAISRPTIREAMRILEWEGFVSVTRGSRGGATVNPLAPDIGARASGLALQAQGATLKDIYFARTLIEPPAARLCAEHRSREAAAALRLQIEEEYRSTADKLVATTAAAGFHRVLMQECGSPTLAVIGMTLHGVVERYLQASNLAERRAARDERRATAGLASHERLIALIEAQDGPGAEAHWAEHMEIYGDFWLKDVSSRWVIDVLE